MTRVKKCRVVWKWTSWTFGIWWGRFTPSKSAPNHFGIELGPLNIVWVW